MNYINSSLSIFVGFCVYLAKSFWYLTVLKHIKKRNHNRDLICYQFSVSGKLKLTEEQQYNFDKI